MLKYYIVIIGCLGVNLSIFAMDMASLKNTHKSVRLISAFMPHSQKKVNLPYDPEKTTIADIKCIIKKRYAIPVNMQQIRLHFTVPFLLQEPGADDVNYSIPLKDTDKIQEIVYQNGCNTFQISSKEPYI